MKRLTGHPFGEGPYPENHLAEGLPAKQGSQPAVVVKINRAIDVAVDILIIRSHGALHVEGRVHRGRSLKIARLPAKRLCAHL